MEHLTDTVYLPSRGMFYNGKYSGKIVIDMINFEMEKQIFGSPSEDALNKVIEMCVLEPKDFKVSDLMKEDRDFLLWKIRIHSYGENYKVYYRDINGERKEKTISLDSLEIKNLDESFTLPEGTLPKSGRKVVLRPLTIGQQDKIDEYVRDKAKKLNIDIGPLRYEYTKAKRIYKIDGKETTTQEAVEFLNSLRGTDLAYIDWLYNKIESYGYNLSTEVELSSGVKIKIPVEVNGEFFRPTFD